MSEKFDFSGWATKNDILCTDGRIIRRDAFKGNDGGRVPLVWNHKDDSPDNVLGHAILENRDEGVYAYCKFNNSPKAEAAKEAVVNGDITSLSIRANKLKHRGRDVVNGIIREVSLVLAGANPEAYVDAVLSHSDDDTLESVTVYTIDETIDPEAGEFELMHSDDPKKDDDTKDDPDSKKPDDKTVKEVIDSMTEEQKTVMYALVGQALEEKDSDEDEEEDVKHSDEEDEDMKENIFDRETAKQEAVLSHADEMEIIRLAKSSGVGSFKAAMEMFAADNEQLVHGIDEIEKLFPDPKDLKPGAPETISRDQSWVDKVIDGIHKSPISRVRLRNLDARQADIRAFGYKKGAKKKNIGNVKLITRTTDPQTVYVKDSLHRDDILDIEDFDAVQYVYALMRQTLKEELATAVLIGDGRDEGDPDKISEQHIRSIWKDDELFTIHADVDIDAARAEIQGTNTGVYFGDNFIYAEAIVNASLYSRENFKGSGTPSFFCTPHLLNVMLLARDRNGHRMYHSKADLEAALNVKEIITVEQLEGQVRKNDDNEDRKLLGIFVNLADYQFGSAKGGEITNMEQFDIDFNQYKYLMETRLSGAPTRIKYAIALEINPTKEPTPSGVIDGGTYGDITSQG